MKLSCNYSIGSVTKLYEFWGLFQKLKNEDIAMLVKGTTGLSENLYTKKKKELFLHTIGPVNTYL